MKKFLYFIFLLFFIIVKQVDAKILQVPFISQVPPGDWNNSLNCGQTSYYMADNYLSSENTKLSYDKIMEIDDFLYKTYGDPVRKYNGSRTNVAKLKRVAEEMDGYTEVHARFGNDDFDIIKKEFDEGSMIIPLVRIAMKMGLDGHFMLLTGYDDENVYFNDPGMVFGKNNSYSIEDFKKVWKSKNYNYLLIKPKQKQKEIEIASNNKYVIDTMNIIVDEKTIKENNGQYLVDLLNSVFGDNTSQNNNSSTGSNDSSKQNNTNETNKNSQQNISNNESNKTEKDINENNVGYGYISNQEIDEDNKEEQNQEKINNDIDEESQEYFIPNFKVLDKYQAGRLVVPFEFYFYDQQIDASKYYFEMDYKKNDEEWTNLFSEFNMKKYDFFVRSNGDTHSFRIRACNEYHNCSRYTEFSHYIYLKPSTDMEIIGYDGNDVVMDREEYRDVCFDIDEGQIVLIEKGTTVTLTPNCNMRVNGYLFAMGEENERIIFKSFLKNWKQIFFEDSFGSILQHVDFYDGGFKNNVNNTFPVIEIKNSIVLMDDITIHKPDFSETIKAYDNSAMYLMNSKIENRIIVENSVAHFLSNIINSDEKPIGYPIVIKNSDDIEIIDNIIMNSSFAPIYLENSFPDIIEDNIAVNAESCKVAMLNVKDLNDNQKHVLKRGEYLVDKFFIGENDHIVIDPGVVIKFGKYSQIEIRGKLDINGKENDQVIFTSFHDDEHGSNISVVDKQVEYVDKISFSIINAKDINIKNCKFLYFKGNMDSTGIFNITNSKNINLDKCYIMGDEILNTIYVGDSENVTIKNCYIDTGTVGIRGINSNIKTENNVYKNIIIKEKVD